MKYAVQIARNMEYANCGEYPEELIVDKEKALKELKDKAEAYIEKFSCVDSNVVYKDEKGRSIIKHRGIEGTIYINNQEEINRVQTRIGRRLVEYGLNHKQVNSVIIDLIRELSN